MKNLIFVVSVFLALLISIMFSLCIFKIIQYFFKGKKKDKNELQFENFEDESFKSDWHRKIELFLSKSGANYRYNQNRQIMAQEYLLFCVFIALFFSVLVFITIFIIFKVNIIISLFVAGLVAMVAGLLPKVFIIYGNKVSNDEMLEDISHIYRELFLQLDAGVFITEAFSECKQVVKIPRLKIAISDFGRKIRMTGDIDIAIDEFESKFDNFYISILCMAIRQLQKNGRNLKLLSDMEVQMKNVQQQRRLKQSEEMEMKAMILQFGLYAVLVIIMLAFIFIGGNMSFNGIYK